MKSIICDLCKREIGQIVPGAAGKTAPGIRDSTSGSTFYSTPIAVSTHGVCVDCHAKYLQGGLSK
jgi:hypothetical protein